MLEQLQKLGLRDLVEIEGRHYIPEREASIFLGIGRRSINDLFHRHPKYFGEFKRFDSEERKYYKNRERRIRKGEKHLSIYQFCLVCLYLKRDSNTADLMKLLFAKLLTKDGTSHPLPSLEQNIVESVRQNRWEANHA